MVSWPAFSLDNFQTTPGERYQGPPRNLKPIREYKVKPELQPPNYEIKGIDPASKILFVNVNIIESSGREPYKGSIYIQGSCLSFFSAYKAKAGKKKTYNTNRRAHCIRWIHP